MQFNTREFNYHDGTFSAEASDFGNYQFKNMFCQVFPDSCDEGFELVSNRTGAAVKMLLNRVHHRDGELTHWEFTPYKCDKFKNLIVFND